MKNEREVAALRIANGMVSTILDALCAAVKPGVPTMYFEEVAQRMCKEMGVKPSFLGYQGYPYALCCSVNEVIVHGFPSKDCMLQKGDIVSFDMGVQYQGFHGDSSRTALVYEDDENEVSSAARALSEATKQSLYEGIKAALPGNDVYAISAAVERYAKSKGYKIIQRFVGHGIGAKLHEKPEIPNFLPGVEKSGITLKPGMVLAIEPMLAIGTHEVNILPDGWTAVTRDRSLAAHWEHSIVVRNGDPEILSISSNYA